MFRRALAVALALSAPIMVPAIASGHPAAGSGGFGTSENWLIPTAKQGEETAESAASTGTNAGHHEEHARCSPHFPRASSRDVNVDLAFWGKYAIMGNYDGLSVLDISEPEAPTLRSETFCPGSQNDVSVYRNLIVTSTDSQRNNDSCNSRAFSRGRWRHRAVGGTADLGLVRSRQPAVHQVRRDRLRLAHAHDDPGPRERPADRLRVVLPPEQHGQLPAAARQDLDRRGPADAPGPGARASTSRCCSRPAASRARAAATTSPPTRRRASRAGACMGEGIMMDISRPRATRR